MTDRPIIFSAPMVQALLAGRKTQTRRLLKKPTAIDALAVFGPKFLTLPGNVDLVGYAPGDRLYVREAMCWVSSWGWRYRADNDDLTEKREAGEVGRWRPSIHMPRWASRLTLTVTEVRVQRLQDISAADAVAEGALQSWTGSDPESDTRTALNEFEALWNSLHGPGAWATNPWVVAVSFTVQHGNIDAVKP